jgi:hypothetical protein
MNFLNDDWKAYIEHITREERGELVKNAIIKGKAPRYEYKAVLDAETKEPICEKDGSIKTVRSCTFLDVTLNEAKEIWSYVRSLESKVLSDVQFVESLERNENEAQKKTI